MWISTAVLATLGITYMTLSSCPIRCDSITPRYENCESLAIAPTNYTKEELVNVGKHIYDIAVSHHTGNIYIAYLKWPMLVLKKGEHKVRPIVGIYDVILSVVVMYSDPKVYIGCRTKVKMYNEITGRVTNILKIPYGIQKLFIHRNTSELYAVRKSDYNVYVYRNQLSTATKLNIKVFGSDLNRFVVDGKGNYFYTSEENLQNVTRIISKELNSTIITYNGGTFYNLAVDNGGRVFGTANGSLYHLKADESKPQFVTVLGFEPCCMCFDKYNNIVFGTRDENIIILKHNQCSVPPSSETTNAIITLNKTLQSVSNEFIRPESNRTIELDVNMYDVLMSEIKTVKENQKSLIAKYNDVMLKINNTAEEINKKLEESNRRLKKENAKIESKIEEVVVGKFTKVNLTLVGNKTLDL